jgi:hypothetical protein
MIGGAWTRIIREFSAVSLVKRLFTNSEFTKGGRFLDHILRVIHKTKLHLFYTQIFLCRRHSPPATSSRHRPRPRRAAAARGPRKRVELISRASATADARMSGGKRSIRRGGARSSTRTPARERGQDPQHGRVHKRGQARHPSRGGQDLHGRVHERGHARHPSTGGKILNTDACTSGGKRAIRRGGQDPQHKPQHCAAWRVRANI